MSCIQVYQHLSLRSLLSPLLDPGFSTWSPGRVVVVLIVLVVLGSRSRSMYGISTALTARLDVAGIAGNGCSTSTSGVITSISSSRSCRTRGSSVVEPPPRRRCGTSPGDSIGTRRSSVVFVARGVGFRPVASVVVG